MDMGHDMGGGDTEMPRCVISMLWNWNTIDSCFLASTWHITSRSMFAGSCIGVVFLTICLEFLRRVAREYDSFIIRRARTRMLLSQTPPVSSSVNPKDNRSTSPDNFSSVLGGTPPAATTSNIAVRPNVIEQFIRAVLHLFQFAVAYFIMLLAMYFNGYIIISIFIGAFLGSLVFSWEVLGDDHRNDATAVTKCCG